MQLAVCHHTGASGILLDSTHKLQDCSSIAPGACVESVIASIEFLQRLGFGIPSAVRGYGDDGTGICCCGSFRVGEGRVHPWLGKDNQSPDPCNTSEI